MKDLPEMPRLSALAEALDTDPDSQVLRERYDLEALVMVGGLVRAYRKRKRLPAIKIPYLPEHEFQKDPV